MLCLWFLFESTRRKGMEMKNGHGNIVDSRHVTRNIAPESRSNNNGRQKIHCSTHNLSQMIWNIFEAIGFYELQPISYRLLNICTHKWKWIFRNARTFIIIRIFFSLRQIEMKSTKMAKCFTRDFLAYEPHTFGVPLVFFVFLESVS